MSILLFLRRGQLLPHRVVALRKGLDSLRMFPFPLLYEVPKFPHPALGIAGDDANPVLYVPTHSTPYSATIPYRPVRLLIVER